MTINAIATQLSNGNRNHANQLIGQFIAGWTTAPISSDDANTLFNTELVRKKDELKNQFKAKLKIHTLSDADDFSVASWSNFSLENNFVICSPRLNAGHRHHLTRRILSNSNGRMVSALIKDASGCFALITMGLSSGTMTDGTSSKAVSPRKYQAEPNSALAAPPGIAHQAGSRSAGVADVRRFQTLIGTVSLITKRLRGKPALST